MEDQECILYGGRDGGKEKKSAPERRVWIIVCTASRGAPTHQLMPVVYSV